MSERPPSFPGRTRRLDRPLSPPARVPARPSGGAVSRRTPLALLALGIATLLFIVSLNGWLLTSRDTGERYLRHALARITEIDRLIVEGHDDVRAAAAAASEPGATVQLPGYALRVDLPAEFAASADARSLRDAVLRRSAERVYDDGASAFLDEGARAGPGGTFSATGAVRRALSLVGGGSHTLFAATTLVFGAACAALNVAVWRRGHDILAATAAAGLAIAAGAVAALAGALLVRGLTSLLRAVEDEYLATQLLAIVAEATMLLVRTSAIFALAGAALALCAWWLRRASAGGRA